MVGRNLIGQFLINVFSCNSKNNGNVKPEDSENVCLWASFLNAISAFLIQLNTISGMPEYYERVW